MAALSPLERGLAQAQQDSAGQDVQPAAEAEIDKAYGQLKHTFASGRTKTYEWRLQSLTALKKLIVENQDAIIEAIGQDLGRPSFETFVTEIGPVVAEIDDAISSLKSWMAPEKVKTPLILQPTTSQVVREPKGQVLIISPWNFPINLVICPAVAAIAAGNCVLLKPSEMAPATEKFMAELVPKYLGKTGGVAVITGGVPETTALLKLKWDHIFYTGNSFVARIVARAAAEHLTPISLELGGKSPTIILPGANLVVATKRMLNFKFLNAGQICIAPDYVLVHKDVEEAFIAQAQKQLKEFFGEDAKSKDYGRIINRNHFNRIRKLIETADGEVLPQLGVMDEESKFIPPTLIRNCNPNCAVMQEEIFGPVLPILKKNSVDEMVAHINANEKPLALYVFGPPAEADKIIARTSSGGVCVNDAVYHFANPHLPFGGVGNSGMGKCHGKWGFEEFSHTRSVMYRATWVDLAQRYPPYTEENQRLFERLMIGPLCCGSAPKQAAVRKDGQEERADTPLKQNDYQGA